MEKTSEVRQRLLDLAKEYGYDDSEYSKRVICACVVLSNNLYMDHVSLDFVVGSPSCGAYKGRDGYIVQTTLNGFCIMIEGGTLDSAYQEAVRAFMNWRLEYFEKS